ncbi:MAG: PucR family transcriptional regulator, partial [Anaerococcus obesiensis]
DKDANINNLYLKELYNNYIKPILIYDKSKKTNLYETLSTFFSNNLSYKNTSEALFIHVNTLRARIKNIESITGIDFNNIDSIINIKMAQLAFEAGTMNEFLYNSKI